MTMPMLRSPWLKSAVPAAVSVVLVLVLVCQCTQASAASSDANAQALGAKYLELLPQLKTNPYQRSLVIQSSERGNAVQGDVFAVVDAPFAAVVAGLTPASNWCEMLILHINIKYCKAVVGTDSTVLRVYVGRKTPQELAQASLIEFGYRVDAADAEYLRIALQAPVGPVGTSDYGIVLQATQLPGAKTFLHLTYAYSVSLKGRIATQTYLATLGKDKVGFTVVPANGPQAATYIGGVRGVLERNAMRYYLAINAFLASGEGLLATQREARLQRWFSDVERYPRQLHDMPSAEYMQMKRAEITRQTEEPPQ